MSTTHEEGSAGLIKTPSQTLLAASLGFLVPVFVIMGLVFYFTSATKPEAGSTNTAQVVDQRIQKVGTVAVGDGTQEEAAAPAAPAAAAPVAVAAVSDEDAGKKLYETTCAACHGTGAAGAPKFGDKAAWAPRLAAGFDEVLKIATSGKGAMPPKGGSNASDAVFKAAVEHLVNSAK